MVLNRQGGDGEINTVSDAKVELMSAQIISYAGQAKQIVDQMMFTGTDLTEIDLVLPSTPVAFAAGSHIHKVFHPQGGGLNTSTLPALAVNQVGVDPVPGWYLGQFNSVDWSDSAANDLILVAYQLSIEVCAAINEVVNGSPAIPVLNDSIKELMIDDANHTGTNLNFTAALCPACDGVNALCVQNQSMTTYGFYSILAQQ